MLMTEVQKWVEIWEAAVRLKNKKVKEIQCHQEKGLLVEANSGMSCKVKQRQKNELATILINSKKLKRTPIERFQTEGQM